MPFFTEKHAYGLIDVSRVKSFLLDFDIFALCENLLVSRPSRAPKPQCNGRG